MKFLAVPLTFFTIILSLSTYSQKYTYKESSQFDTKVIAAKHFLLKDNNYYAVYGNLPTLNNKKTYNPEVLHGFMFGIVNKYDEKFKQVYSKPLPQNMNIDGVISNNNKIFIIYHEENSSPISIALLDEQSGNIVKRANLFSTFIDEYMYYSISPDGNSIIVSRASEKSKKNPLEFEISILDSDLQSKKTFSAPLDYKGSDVLDQYMFIDNKRNAFIIYRVKEDKKAIPSYHLYSLNETGKRTRDSQLQFPDGFMPDMTFSYDGNQIHCGGLKSLGRKDDYTSFVYGSIDPNTGNTNLKEIILSGPQPNFDAANAKVLSKPLSADFIFDQSLIDDNGSFIYIFEKNNMNEHIERWGESVTSREAFRVKFFRRETLLAVKVNKDYSIAWIKIIPKIQEEPDMRVLTGIISALDENGTVHIIFQDRDKNLDIKTDEKPATFVIGDLKKSSLVDVSIDNKGNIRKSQVQSDGDRESYIAPDNCTYLKPGIIGTLSLNFHMFKKWNYNLGLINIK